MQNVEENAEEKQARCEWFCFDVVKRATIKYDPRVTDVDSHRCRRPTLQLS